MIFIDRVRADPTRLRQLAIPVELKL